MLNDNFMWKYGSNMRGKKWGVSRKRTEDLTLLYVTKDR